MIEVSNITKRYGDVTALQELNLSIPAGSIFGLLGPNGAGKTTLLRLIVGLLAPDQGDIQISGCQRHQIGYLPENPHFPGRFRIREFLRVSGQTSGLSGRQMREKALKLLDYMNLSDKASRKPTELTGGERQRVAIARSLANDPSIILADEHTGSLDSKNGDMILNLLKDLHDKEQVTLIMVTHDLKVAALAERTIEVLDGKIKT